MILRNPADGEYVDAPKKADVEIKVWDVEQTRLFLAEAKRSSKHYALYLFCLCTAARQGEALALTWDDLDLMLGSVAIKRKVYRLNGELLVGKPKSRHGVREVPLPPMLVEELRRLKDNQRERQALLGDRYEGHNLVFDGWDGKYLHVRNLINRDFLKVIQRARVPRIRFHDLRHSAASYLIALGVDVNTVSKILGHHSAHFTLARYVHDVSGTKASAITKLEAHLLEPVSDNNSHPTD